MVLYQIICVYIYMFMNIWNNIWYWTYDHVVRFIYHHCIIPNQIPYLKIISLNHIMKPYHIPGQIIYHIKSYHIISYHIISYIYIHIYIYISYTIPYHIISYHIISHIISHTIYHTSLYHIVKPLISYTISYIISSYPWYHIQLYCMASQYITPYHIILIWIISIYFYIRVYIEIHIIYIYIVVLYQIISYHSVCWIIILYHIPVSYIIHIFKIHSGMNPSNLAGLRAVLQAPPPGSDVRHCLSHGSVVMRDMGSEMGRLRSGICFIDISWVLHLVN